MRRKVQAPPTHSLIARDCTADQGVATCSVKPGYVFLLHKGNARECPHCGTWLEYGPERNLLEPK